jgi:hypothetical protein
MDEGQQHKITNAGSIRLNDIPMMVLTPVPEELGVVLDELGVDGARMLGRALRAGPTPAHRLTVEGNQRPREVEVHCDTTTKQLS